MSLLSGIKQHILGISPVDHGDVAGLVVRERDTGEVVHHEHFPSGRYTSDRVASTMEKRREALAQKYSGARYEIEHGVFGDLDAMHHFFPETRKPKL